MSAEGPEELTSSTVFQLYRDRIHRYIVGSVRDESEAEDLTQETFLRAHRQLHTLRDPAAVAVWLYRIATNVCYDRFREASYRNRAVALDPGAEGSGGDPEQQPDASHATRLDHLVEQAEMSTCVQGFLEELPDDYRMVILLHDLHDMTNPEIAQMLGCSLHTVKIRVHRARRRLKAALAAGCEFSHDDRGVLICDRKPGNSPPVR